MIAELTKSECLFEKRTVADLSEHEMLNINGGSGPLQLEAAGAAIVYAGYRFGHWLYEVTH